MKITKSLIMALSLALFVFAVPLTGRADDWNRETTVTFNQPIEIPGMVLAPGTYVLKLLDSNVVQIYNADQTHLYENVLAIPAQRSKLPDRPIVTLNERGKGDPQAIGAWFYPGDNYGEQFVYPGDKLEVKLK